MSNHTPEPWVTGRKDMQSYHGDTGEPFSSVYREADDDRMPMGSDGFGGKVRIPLRIAYIEGRDIPRDEEKANADRIVACVNACAGMDDPAATIAALRAERDGLMVVAAAVVKAIKYADSSVFTEDNWNPDAHIEIVLTVAECQSIVAALAAGQGKTREKKGD